MDTADIWPMTRSGRVEKFHFSEALAKRLVVEKVLDVHKLCVNRLAWNAEGTRLLSGSDDKRLVMHPFPSTDQLPLSIATEHVSNIFGVQFLPHSRDQILISGAMDRSVQLHRLDAPPDATFSSPTLTDDGSPDSVEVVPGTVVFGCHRGRVKDVEVDSESPHLFWSASEDGTIRQFDIRCSFAPQMEPTSPNVLIGVRSRNGADSVDLKGIDINKACPHQMGVACGDSFVRLFDRRKLSLGSVEDTFPEPVLKLSPPHMPILGVDDEERCHSTYVNFSHRGDKLVASFHADHAYAFDITSEGTAACTYIRRTSPTASQNGHVRNGHRSSSRTIPSEEAAQQRLMAMHHLQAEDYTKAIRCLDEALRRSPDVPQFYVERAQSSFRRRLSGDVMFALRDCDQAIALDPDRPDAYFCRCECMEALCQYQTAHRSLRIFLDRFPERRHAEDVSALRHKIATKLEVRRKSTSSKRTREDNAEADEDEDNEDIQMTDVDSRGGTAGSEAGPSGSVPGDSLEDESECDECLYPFYNKEQDGTDHGRPNGIWWNTQGGRRMLMRYVGHRNVQTDIKECIFMGHNDSLVACGSDDGNVFIYNAETGNPVNVLKADESVSNCVQCHPSVACLATSGIESVVRLWTPTGDAIKEEDVDDCVSSCVQAMKRGTTSRLSGMQMIRMLFMDNDIADVFWRI